MCGNEKQHSLNTGHVQVAVHVTTSPDIPMEAVSVLVADIRKKVTEDMWAINAVRIHGPEGPRSPVTWDITTVVKQSSG